MTTSKTNTKKATATPTTKARAAQRSAKTALRKAEPAPRAASVKKPATAARSGTKTDKILDLLKRPGGVTLQELVKATGWQPHSVRGFLSSTIGKKMGRRSSPSKALEETAPTASPPSNLLTSAADSPAALVPFRAIQPRTQFAAAAPCQG